MAVVGPVGCGKSSLLSALLGEMEKLDGNVNVRVSWFFGIGYLVLFLFFLCKCLLTEPSLSLPLFISLSPPLCITILLTE